jgi:hypothetical protein
MRVRVLRVSEMPRNARCWVDRQPTRCTYYIDATLVTPRGAEVLSATATWNASTLPPFPHGRMIVELKRVSGMPRNAECWVDRQSTRCTYYIDETLVTDEGAAVLGAAATWHVGVMRRLPRQTAG